jgi:crotonobetainyl-CoA:carnitine CoA-transferase CaiB-like acyl-CoA transferase
MFACYSILAALREKDRSGRGQYLDVSMMDTLVSLMFMENLEESIEAGLPLRTGNISRSGPTGLYSAMGGDLSITVTSDDQWRRMTNALEAPELLEDSRFDTYVKRTDNVEEARVEIQGRIGKMTLEEALQQLESHDVPCAPVRTAEQVMNDAHFWDRGSLMPMNHGAMNEPVDGAVAAGFPVRFSGGELPPIPGAPTLGMHNHEVLAGILGLSDAELVNLKADGVV